jgi:hypothetical protein
MEIIMKRFFELKRYVEEEYGESDEEIKFYCKNDYIEGNDDNAKLFLKDVDSYGNSGHVDVNVIDKSIKEMKGFVNKSFESDLELVKAYVELNK